MRQSLCRSKELENREGERSRIRYIAYATVRDVVTRVDIQQAATQNRHGSRFFSPSHRVFLSGCNPRGKLSRQELAERHTLGWSALERL